ncbi:MAG: hypothetical protein ACR2MD_08880 [Aridibacter sp.]
MKVELKELPPRKPVESVTEGTTNLLDEEWANNFNLKEFPVCLQRGFPY